MMKETLSVPRSSLLAAILVLTAATFSAGVHVGLTPEHLGETLPLGASFIAASVALLALGITVLLRPRTQLPAVGIALLFALLVLAYTASRTTGLPLLEPEAEPFDTLGIATQAVQLAGLAGALWLVGQPAFKAAGNVRFRRSRGRWAAAAGGLTVAGVTLVVSTTLALAAADSHGHHGDHGDPGHDHGENPALVTEHQH